MGAIRKAAVRQKQRFILGVITFDTDVTKSSSIFDLRDTGVY